ncbi:zinc finger protein 547-like isoform X2 [Lagenorhynchus albirostris]|uniref:zinc finger protein 547-like isoform X2 n=1 Tax=Lagenorhynchus albirostris TaxID=27610 RepID=UPI0028E92719|nr:zinc finger protein 547-like isoform X2 [Lagenorhynchus albirostris]
MGPIQEEWGLLDEAQRLLYRHVMLQNIAPSSSIGCRHSAQDEEALSEQGDVVRESQVKTPKLDPSIQKSHSCEICGPLLKHILHLAEHDGTPRARGVHVCVKSFPAPKGAESRASLVAQWLRVRLPMQGTRVRALVR